MDRKFLVHALRSAIHCKVSCCHVFAFACVFTLLVLIVERNGNQDPIAVQQAESLNYNPTDFLSRFSTRFISSSKSSSPLASASSFPSSSSNKKDVISSASSLSATLSSARSSSLSKPAKQQLLLVTKGRSGSSFTSALIRNDSKVFYTFEPLFTLSRENGTHISIFGEEYRETAYNILRAFLVCDFSHIHGKQLNNFQIRNSGDLGRRFLKCVRSTTVGFMHMECLLEMIRTCQEKSVLFSKVIRFPMRWAEPFLQELPNLQILYLIRDPRAVLYSQSKVFKNLKWPEEVEMKGAEHCNQLKEDFMEIDRLQVLYPGRIRVIQYERGALYQAEYAKEIYKFVKLKFTNNTKSFLRTLREPAQGNAGMVAYSLHRENAIATMNKWRFGAGYKAANHIDKACGALYPKLGYLPVLSQQDLESNRMLFNTSVNVNKGEHRVDFQTNGRRR